VRELAARVVERTIEIAAVAAPPLDEGDRTARVRDWWTADGLAGLRVDPIGNVWARLRDGRPGGATDAVVVAAHLDTVFARSVAHGATRDGGRLLGPSVGDDSVALAALSALDALLPADVAAPVWILATVGEEGLGNLAGITAALADPPVPIGALVALEGNWLGRVCHVAVGSVRWRVTVTAPGGHAWERADAPSAVHTAARAVAAVVDVDRPRDAASAINVGRIGGGESINSKAQHAWFEIDLRADSQAALEALDVSVRRAVAAVVAREERAGVTVAFEEIGRRPAGALPRTHPLVEAASGALRAAGREVTYTAASTDANAAHPAGVPAVAVGVTIGAGEHTEDEWIEVDPVAAGLPILADTVVRAAATLDQERA
jgi:acetylornithine deacetylase/succinyl-diaminopimelate desuccinylase-like protein